LNNVYSVVIITYFTKCQAVANPQTKPTDLGCESTCRLPLTSTPTVAIYYYYSAQMQILILPSHRGRKAEST